MTQSNYKLVSCCIQCQRSDPRDLIIGGLRPPEEDSVRKVNPIANKSLAGLCVTTIRVIINEAKTREVVSFAKATISRGQIPSLSSMVGSVVRRSR